MGVVSIIHDVFSDYYYGHEQELCKSCIYVDEHYTNLNFDTCYTLLGVECRVGHDGYDKMGAKSNIFDVYVFYRKNGDTAGIGDAAGNGDDVNIYMDIWHAEQWFIKNEIIILDLSETYLFTNNEDYQSFVSWVHKGGFNCRPDVSNDACIYKNYGGWDDWDETQDSYSE